MSRNSSQLRRMEEHYILEEQPMKSHKASLRNIPYVIIIHILQRRMLKVKACLVQGHTVRLGLEYGSSILNPVPFPLPTITLPVEVNFQEAEPYLLR